MSDKKYNGWSNYETWLVNGWFESCEHGYGMLRQFAKDSIRCTELHGRDRDHAVYECSKMIQNEVEERMPELDGMFADLLNSALSEVAWYEIAEHIVGDMLNKMKEGN